MLAGWPTIPNCKRFTTPGRDPFIENDMKILFFGDADSVHLQRWVHEMTQRGAVCHVATRRPAAIPAAASMHVIRPGLGSAAWFLALPEVRSLTRALQPDVVHGHYVTSNGLWAAASGHPRVVLTAWGSDILLTPQKNKLWRALTKWTLHRAQLITADSDDVLQAIARFQPMALLQEVSWGADTDRFKPPAQGRSAQPVQCVSLRAWESNYQIHRIIDAYAQAKLAEPQQLGALHLLGGGSLESALRNQVRHLGLTQDVVFHGKLAEDAMLAVMQRCAVSISLPLSDATSVSLLESMACGMAMLVSDLPANRQWVNDQGGRLVDASLAVSGNARITQALLQLVRAGATTLNGMGSHNRALIEERASRRVEMDKMWSLYQRCLAAA
jgi:glycosyltransferase involved in cell wall biosynthesis